MKKILIALLALFAIIACSEDDNNLTLPQDGDYAYIDDTCAISCAIIDHKLAGITVYKNRKVAAQELHTAIKVQGQYPDYTYTIHADEYGVEEFVLNARFSHKAFQAEVVKGHLTQIFDVNNKPVYIPARFSCSKDVRVIDENRDGLID